MNYLLAGSMFLLYSAPILIIAFLAIAYLIISGGEEQLHRYVICAWHFVLKNLMLSFILNNVFLFNRKQITKRPRFSLWTFPVLIDGIFGVVSAAEMIGIILFSLYIIWAVTLYTLKNYKLLSWFHVVSKREER